MEVKAARYPTGRYKDGDEVIKFDSSDSNNLPTVIKDIHINCYSDIFDPTKDYVGFIVYLCGKKNNFKLGDVHCNTGDIFIKQSDWIKKHVRKRRKRGEYLHGRLFYSIFGRWKKKKLEFIGAGFSYYKGEWKFLSRTFNTMNPGNNDDTYHDQHKRLAENEEKLLKNVTSRVYENHHWLKMPTERRVSLKELSEMKTLVRNGTKHELNLITIHKDRKLHGVVTSFHNHRHYGFIKCHGIDQDIFVHSSEIQCCPSGQFYFGNGVDVEFNIVGTQKGWKATNLTSFFYYN